MVINYYFISYATQQYVQDKERCSISPKLCCLNCIVTKSLIQVGQALLEQVVWKEPPKEFKTWRILRDCWRFQSSGMWLSLILLGLLESEDEGISIFRNVWNYTSSDTASHARRMESEGNYLGVQKKCDFFLSTQRNLALTAGKEHATNRLEL